MYGRAFESMYTGSMVGSGPVAFAVWGYVIAHARGDDFTVELNPYIIAAIIGCPVDQVKEVIERFCQPDEFSRTPDEDGRKLIREGQFQFRVVNKKKYDALASEEHRREMNREYQQNSRAKKQKSFESFSVSTQCQGMSADVSTCQQNTSNVSTSQQMSANSQHMHDVDALCIKANAQGKQQTAKKADTAPLSCAESEKAPTPAPPLDAVIQKTIIDFPVNGDPKRTSWSLTQSVVDKFKAAFPTMDIVAECRKALCWIEMNPTRKKTARGMPKFLNGWIARAQNSGYTAKGSNGTNAAKRDPTAYFSPEYAVEVSAAIAESKANTQTSAAFLAEKARKRVQAGADSAVPI